MGVGWNSHGLLAEAETSLKTESLGKMRTEWGKVEKTDFSGMEVVQWVNKAHLQNATASTKCSTSMKMKISTWSQPFWMFHPMPKYIFFKKDFFFNSHLVSSCRTLSSGLVCSRYDKFIDHLSIFRIKSQWIFPLLLQELMSFWTTKAPKQPT